MTAMGVQRTQGLIFCMGALLLTAATATRDRFDQGTELIVLAVLIILVGVPHGALDTIFARHLYGVRTIRGWIGFGLAYIALAALIVGVWQIAPILFLAGFLLISVAHFSGDPSGGTPLVSRILYGGAVILLPALLHADAVTRLFSTLVGMPAAALVVGWLRVLGWPWLASLGIAAIHRATSDWRTGLEMATVGILALLAPPLLAFTMFFCGMHSPRHILRTVTYSGRASLHSLLMAAVPMLAVLVLSAAAWYYSDGIAPDARVIRIVFVGLAALTVPHMAVVEQVRLSGWTKGTAPRPL